MFRQIFIMAMSLGLLAGCSKTELQERADGRITLGVNGVTRAVNNLSDLAAVGDRIGIYGAQTAGASADVPVGDLWGVARIMDNICTTGIDPLTGQIAWAGDYYYPLEESRNVKFCAYHPYAAVGSAGNFSVEAPAAGQAPRLHFTLSGIEDVMYANPVVGSRSTVPGGMEFRHPLTQLQFQLVDQYGTFAGATLNSITFLGANTTASMNIETGALGAWSNPGSVTVAGIDTPVAISGAPGSPQKVGKEVMLEPGQPGFTLKVVTSLGTYESVTVRPTSSVGGTAETSFAAGRSYLVTLTFQRMENLALTATVVPWQMGGAGEGVIQ